MLKRLFFISALLFCAIPSRAQSAGAAPRPSAQARAQKPVDSFVCDVCSVSFQKAQALRMHKTVKHPKKEKVGAT